MKALRFAAFGGPEVLHLADLPTPMPQTGEVLVEVHAGGLNFADTERRRGLYLAHEPLPETLGFEGAGRVTACGPGVAASWVGQRVAFIAPRAHAQWCAVSVGSLIALPTALGFIAAAAFPVQALTAWHVLHTLGHVARGEAVLVHSAAGGVGQLLVQLAVEAGAYVIGTVSREAKRESVLAQGAHEVLIRGAEPLRPSRPIDLVLEAVGAAVMPELLSMVAPLGRWVTYGTASGPHAPLELEKLYERSVTVSAFWLRTPLPEAVATHAQEQIMARLLDGRLRQTITTCPLEEAPKAHRRLEAGLTMGKWVLTLRPT
jgi:NADPH:quinone reductase